MVYWTVFKQSLKPKAYRKKLSQIKNFDHLKRNGRALLKLSELQCREKTTTSSQSLSGKRTSTKTTGPKGNKRLQDSKPKCVNGVPASKKEQVKEKL